AETTDKGAQIRLEIRVKLSDGFVVERHRRHSWCVDPAAKQNFWLEPDAVGLRRSGRSLKMNEMLQHFRPEWRELDDNAGRESAWTERKIVSAQRRGRTQRGGDVTNSRQMSHLVDRHAKDGSSPSGNRHRFLLGEPIPYATFETEG